ncbi:MAG: SDR family oxidoreductase [Thermomicrobiales bacterium]
MASDGRDLGTLAAGLQVGFGVIHGFVHSVGFAPPDELKITFEKPVRSGFATTEHQCLLVDRHLTAGGRADDRGRIDHYPDLPGRRSRLPQYNVMEAWPKRLEASVRYLAFDLGRDGIRVNVSAGQSDCRTPAGFLV